MESTWWGSRTKPSPRMVAEIAAMKLLFNPREETLVETQTGWDVNFYVQTESLELDTSNPYEPFWLATFGMRNAQSGSRVNTKDVFQLKILYPSSYPDDEPRVTVESHDTQGSPHRFRGGYLCLYTHGDTRNRGWDPAKSTAATFALWSVQWIRAWIYWKRTDMWPEAS